METRSLTVRYSSDIIHGIIVDADLPEHSLAARMGIVLEGSIESVIGGEKHCFTRGDRYYIPEGVKHTSIENMEIYGI